MVIGFKSLTDLFNGQNLDHLAHARPGILGSIPEKFFKLSCLRYKLFEVSAMITGFKFIN